LTATRSRGWTAFAQTRRLYQAIQLGHEVVLHIGAKIDKEYLAGHMVPPEIRWSMADEDKNT
jgi:hypothetical protein